MSEVRLNKLMAERGICSRREADQWIQNGWVKVDGVIVSQLGQKVSESCQVEVDKAALTEQNKLVTIILNKPVGIVSNLPEDGYQEALDIIKANNQFIQPGDRKFHFDFLKDLSAAGRLDIDSQGILVLTQDGRIARQLIAQDTEIEKEYIVALRGEVTEKKLRTLRSGLRLDGRQLKPAQIKLVKEPYYQIILREGRKRQIRRMCELVDLEVFHLRRVRVGKIELGNLPLGHWRLLRENESF